MALVQYGACKLTAGQGFDEFMNLVIDDAVEVKQATKTTEESRRQLGEGFSALIGMLFAMKLKLILV